MLEQSGGTAADRKRPEKGGAVRYWRSRAYEWSFIQRVNKVTVTVHSTWDGVKTYRTNVELDKIKAIMTKAEVDAAREAGRLMVHDSGVGFFLAGETPPPAPRLAPAPDPEAEKVQALRQAIRQGVQVVTAPQLFPTPPGLATMVVEAADVRPGLRILEPSAGTGNLLRALYDALQDNLAGVTAVEINPTLADSLKAGFPHSDVRCADFLGCNGNLGEPFDRVVMNPPFENGSDVAHVLHALHFLRPGGILVALCANGPRQREALQPLASNWVDLGPGAFKQSGTAVNAAMVVICKDPLKKEV